MEADEGGQSKYPCLACGNEVGVKHKFCINCGNDSSRESSPERGASKGPLRVALSPRAGASRSPSRKSGRSVSPEGPWAHWRPGGARGRSPSASRRARSPGHSSRPSWHCEGSEAPDLVAAHNPDWPELPCVVGQRDYAGKPVRGAGIIGLRLAEGHTYVCLVEKRNGRLGFPKGSMGYESVKVGALREWIEEAGLNVDRLALL